MSLLLLIQHVCFFSAGRSEGVLGQWELLSLQFSVDSEGQNAGVLTVPPLVKEDFHTMNTVLFSSWMKMGYFFIFIFLNVRKDECHFDVQAG